MTVTLEKIIKCFIRYATFANGASLNQIIRYCLPVPQVSYKVVSELSASY